MIIKLSKTKNILLSISLFALVLLIVYGCRDAERKSSERENAAPFALLYKQGDIRQRIKGFYSEGILYFCMPGYMQMEDVELEMGRSQRLIAETTTLGMSGEKVLETGISQMRERETAEIVMQETNIWRNGDNLSGIALETIYQMHLETTGGESETLAVMFMRGSDIPSVRLTTASKNMEYILARKGNFESGYMQVTDAEGRTECMVKVSGISGRGNTAWEAEKKSFTVKLDDAEDLLGMGAEKTWVLNANYYDGAYIRNQVGFELAAAGGIAYVPEAQFVELYINDEYMGLYQLMEKIKAGKNRMDIGNSYLLEIDYRERAAEEEDYIMLSNAQPIVLHAPAKDRDVAGVQKFFDEFGRQMEDENVPMEKIDAASFAKMFVMEDILQDMDFGYTSHYMYLDMEKEMLYDGPVWDMDNTMGRGVVKEAKPLFVTDYDLIYNNLSRWYARLCGQEEFCQLAADEYRENFRPMLIQLAEGGVRKRVQAIRASIDMDAKRFAGVRSVFMRDAFLEEHVTYLETYLMDKRTVMDMCYTSDTADMLKMTELPVLERQESAFEEAQEQQEAEGMGTMECLMQYRFAFILLVMCISSVILWNKCRRMGK